mgnify:CR=1 FL=1
MKFKSYFLTAVGLFALCVVVRRVGATFQLLNVSYDPTRELYQSYNAAFAKYWQAKTGEKVAIKQSHGGSGAQARSVIDGHRRRRRHARARLRHRRDRRRTLSCCPKTGRRACRTTARRTTSTIVFLVRKGNPEEHPRLGRPG